ncbi:N-acetylmuramoyl-L-alanine amidase [Pseudosulfitobacter pseudonitzschiae]|nr:N-acetylmuramoyl-L-alanine amidase [Pseudosulfitobacter pseudonitzschiae]
MGILDASDPNFHYGKSATAHAKPFEGIVWHHTREAPLMNMVDYGKRVDPERGGAFGYHYYIGPDGQVVQGAPTDKRTNHIKPDRPQGSATATPWGFHWSGQNMVQPLRSLTPQNAWARKLKPTTASRRRIIWVTANYKKTVSITKAENLLVTCVAMTSPMTPCAHLAEHRCNRTHQKQLRADQWLRRHAAHHPAPQLAAAAPLHFLAASGMTK